MWKTAGEMVKRQKTFVFYFLTASQRRGIGMSVVEAIASIHAAYTYFKSTYKKLRENEVALQRLLEEICLYEGLIDCSARKIQASPNPDSDPHLGVHVQAIMLFRSSITGIHDLVLDYASQAEQKYLQRAWNFTKKWCCTEENATKITQCTDDMRSAIQILGFSFQIMVHQCVEKVMVQQTEMQIKLCEFIRQLSFEAETG